MSEDVCVLSQETETMEPEAAGHLLRLQPRTFR